MNINQRVKAKVDKDGASAAIKWDDRFQDNKRKLERTKREIKSKRISDYVYS